MDPAKHSDSIPFEVRCLEQESESSSPFDVRIQLFHINQNIVSKIKLDESRV